MPPGNITIVSVSSGSIIVAFKIVTSSDAAASSLSSSIQSFISSPPAGALQSLADNLPKGAFQNSSQGITLDEAGSSSQVVPVTNSPGLSGGAIAGIVVGSVAGVVLISGLVGFLVYRRKRTGGPRGGAYGGDAPRKGNDFAMIE